MICAFCVDNLFFKGSYPPLQGTSQLCWVRLVHHTTRLFNIPDFFQRKRSMDHTLRQPDQRFPVAVANNHIIMNRETRMVPVSHLFHKVITDLVFSLHTAMLICFFRLNMVNFNLHFRRPHETNTFCRDFTDSAIGFFLR